MLPWLLELRLRIPGQSILLALLLNNEGRGITCSTCRIMSRYRALHVGIRDVGLVLLSLFSMSTTSDERAGPTGVGEATSQLARSSRLKAPFETTSRVDAMVCQFHFYRTNIEVNDAACGIIWISLDTLIASLYELAPKFIAICIFLVLTDHIQVFVDAAWFNCARSKV